jgi:chloride channel protein, CIC family
MSKTTIPLRLIRRIRDGFERVARDEHRLTLFLSLMIGAIVGLVIVAFILLTGRLAARMYPTGVQPWRRLLVPTAGSLVAGWLLFRYFPLARGSGIPQTKFALHVANGVITLRTVAGKFVCCAISLASGIALGREGPSVQIGAGLASVIGRGLGLGPERVKALLPVGGAAALAAAFNTPIAAVLFSLEEIVGDLHAPVLAAVVLSAATAWMILHVFLGDAPLFHVAGYQLVNPAEFGIYAVLGVVGGVASGTFVRLLLWLRTRFLRLDQRRAWLHPVAGGLAVGLLGLAMPEVLGVGYDYVERVLNGDVILRVLVLLALLKIGATALCYASGNAGGIFGPSLFIGAMVGGAVGTVAHGLFPTSTAEPGAYALVGMGTAFAGIVRTPMASVIMIFELTRDYSIIVPLMISNLIAFYVSQRLQRVPIYEAIALQDGVHLPTHDTRGYSGARVADVMPARPLRLDADTRIDAGADLIRDAGVDAGPVVGHDGFTGMVRLDELDAAILNGMGERPLRELQAAVAPGAGPAPPHLHPDQSVAFALERMGSSGLRLLPVVSRGNVRHVLGLLTFADAVSSFEAPTQRPAVAPVPAFVGGALLRTFGVVLASSALLAGADLWLARAEAAETRAEASRLFDEGRTLEARGAYDQAIGRYQGALAAARQEPAYEIALARALLAGGRDKEARAVVDALLRRRPTDGEANLTMARVRRDRRNTEDTVRYYRQAVLGEWRDASHGNSLATRLELVEFLARRGLREQLLAELLTLEGLAKDPVVKRRVALLYVTAGAPERSREAWLALRKSTPDDPAVYAGLGEAELAARNVRAAAANFRTALKLRPGDPHLQERLALCVGVLALDPTLRGLSTVQRHERSVALVDQARASLAHCQRAATALQPVVPDAAGTKVRALEVATDANLDLAERLWQTRKDRCGDQVASASDARLALVLTRTAQ